MHEARSQSLRLHKNLTVLSMSGACSALSETERRYRDNQEKAINKNCKEW